MVSWIVGLCSVAFDVDVGQKVTHVVPNGILSDEEKVDIGFHAFPDSMSLELQGRSAIRDSSFMMRIRRRVPSTPQPPVTAGAGSGPASPVADTSGCASDAAGAGPAAASPAVSQEPSYLYGFVFCRQRQDESLRRGGEQVSVVVLSEHPLSGVLKPLSQVAGPLFFSSGFSSGLAALERVYQEVQAWPPPVSGPLLQLQVGYSTLSCRLPSFATLPGPSNLLNCDAVPSRQISRMSSNAGDTNYLSGRLSMNLSNSPTINGLLTASLSTSALYPSLMSVTRATATTATSLSEQDAADAMARANENLSGEFSGVSVQPSADDVGGGHNSATGGTSGGGGNDTSGRGGSAHSGGGGGTSSWPDQVSDLVRETSDDISAAMRSTAHLRRVSLTPNAGEMQLATGAFYEVDIFTPLQPQLHQLWLLWEIALCAKPLMVVAPSPGDTSSTVAALISLIAPVPYSADFRPYYTIQDSAFRRMAGGELPDASPESVPAMLGVTNLYFLRALPHWPSVLSVGKKETHAASWSSTAAAAAASTSTLLPAMALAFNPSAAVKALRQRAAGAQALLGGHMENLWTSYKPVSRPDQVLLLRLLQSKLSDVKSKAARIALANSETIRRHFHELTAAFLAPFTQYFEPGPTGTVPVWSPEAFLFERRAAVAAPMLLERMGSVAKLVELYARFTSSVNFARWYEMRRAPVKHLEEKVPLQLDGFAVFAAAVQHMEEVERIQMFFSVEQQLQEAMVEAAGPEVAPEAQDTVARLSRELLVLFLGMPEDLQQTCVSSPARCELLLSLDLSGEQRTKLAQLLAQLRAGTQAWAAAGQAAQP